MIALMALLFIGAFVVTWVLLAVFWLPKMLGDGKPEQAEPIDVRAGERIVR